MVHSLGSLMSIFLVGVVLVVIAAAAEDRKVNHEKGNVIETSVIVVMRSW